MARRDSSAACTMRSRDACSSSLRSREFGERRLQRRVEPDVVQGEPELAGQLDQRALVVLGERRRSRPAGARRSTRAAHPDARWARCARPPHRRSSSDGTQTAAHARPPIRAWPTTLRSDSFSCSRAGGRCGTLTARARRARRCRSRSPPPCRARSPAAIPPAAAAIRPSARRGSSVRRTRSPPLPSMAPARR